MRIRFLAALAGLLPGLAGSPPAAGFDMDCKVILCLAGGFPAGCGDAHAYMLRRLRSIPPKPPFGTCRGLDAAGVGLRRGIERHFPCADGFRRRQPADRSCCCVCQAFTRSESAALRLAGRARGADGGGFRDVSLLRPSAEADRFRYRVTYACRRRPRPHWFELRLRTGDGGWLVVERFWW